MVGDPPTGRDDAGGEAEEVDESPIRMTGDAGTGADAAVTRVPAVCSIDGRPARGLVGGCPPAVGSTRMTVVLASCSASHSFMARSRRASASSSTPPPSLSSSVGVAVASGRASASASTPTPPLSSSGVGVALATAPPAAAPPRLLPPAAASTLCRSSRPPRPLGERVPLRIVLAAGGRTVGGTPSAVRRKRAPWAPLPAFPADPTQPCAPGGAAGNLGGKP